MSYHYTSTRLVALVFLNLGGWRPLSQFQVLHSHLNGRTAEYHNVKGMSSRTALTLREFGPLIILPKKHYKEKKQHISLYSASGWYMCSNYNVTGCFNFIPHIGTELR